MTPIISTEGVGLAIQEMVKRAALDLAASVDREIMLAMSRWLLHYPESTLMQAIEAGRVSYHRPPDDDCCLAGSLSFKSQLYLSWRQVTEHPYENSGEAIITIKFEREYENPGFRPQRQYG